jgi:CheY-like chemotaxis protein
MKILVAEDDPVSRRVIEATLSKFGYEVVLVADGAQAWAALQGEDPPKLAILDWMMPEIDGVEICRRVRSLSTTTPPYLMLLTAKDQKKDVVVGLDAGANDYLTKPFDRSELCARIQVGTEVLRLQEALALRVLELEDAVSQVKQLQGLLPICSYCKKIRDEQNYWQRVENYLSNHTQVVFSHSICPDCFKTVVQSALDEKNAVVRATTTCDSTLRGKDLPERVQRFQTRSEDNSPPAGEGDEVPLSVVLEWPSLSTIEGRHVEKVLAHTGGNKLAAARLLDVNRKTLDRMIKRHRISVERVASPRRS